MNTTVTELARQASVLPLSDRAHLIDALIESMLHTDQEISAMWVAEVEDRMDAVDRGDLVLQDEPPVLAQFRLRHP